MLAGNTYHIVRWYAHYIIPAADSCSNGAIAYGSKHWKPFVIQRKDPGILSVSPLLNKPRS